MSYQQPPPYGSGPQHPYGQPQQYGAAVPASGDPGTLDLPWYGIGFTDALKRGFQKYARFDGRASRSEYWFFALGVLAVSFVLYIPLLVGAIAESAAITIVFGVLFVLFMLATIVPSIAIAVRRLHDGGFSGWMYLLGFVPFVGGIIVLVLMCLPSKPEGARYDRPGAGPGGHGAGGGYGAPGGYSPPGGGYGAPGGYGR